jgi:hypothetical protein
VLIALLFVLNLLVRYAVHSRRLGT